MKITSKKLITLSILLFSVFYFHNTSALSYQTNTNVQFTFDPTISISVSGDLSIPNLTPGDSKDSNIITVTAESNAISGYTLSSTVGNTTNSSTELRKDNTSTTIKFDSITTNKASFSAFDNNSNTWGYSYCITSNDCTNSTYWQSGDITVTDPTSPLYPTTGYNGLPLYTSTPITLINSPSNNSSSIQFKIGASATSTQIAGEYNNVINFIGLANQNPLTFDDLFAAAGKERYNGYYTMQDMNSTICNNAEVGYLTHLIDIRDGEVYTVSKLKDERCWLLDNLRLDPTDSITAANMNENNTNAPAAAIYNYLHGGNPDNIDGWSSAAANTNWSNSFTVPITISAYKTNNVTNYGVGSGKAGSYYNYCAATVGTYCYDENASNAGIDAEYDICPTNWRMPTGNYDGEYRNLCTVLNNNVRCGVGMSGATSMDASSISSLQYNLSLAFAGYYYNNSQNDVNTYIELWSSTTLQQQTLGRMHTLPASLEEVWSSFNEPRHYGFSVRCIAK